MDKIYGTIAIMGRPNAGKSSLFNRFCKSRIAITSEIAGTTRDVKKANVTLKDTPFLLLDTGGLDESDSLFVQVTKHSHSAGESADLILYVVDGKMPPNPLDKKIFYALQKKNSNIFLVVNKIDNDKEQSNAWEFSEFGACHTFFVSVSHNRGIGKLEDSIVRLLKKDSLTQLFNVDEEESLEEFLEASVAQETEEVINIGIIGRVNVGKS